VFADRKNTTSLLLGKASTTKDALASEQTIQVNVMLTARLINIMLSLVNETAKENILEEQGTVCVFLGRMSLMLRVPQSAHKDKDEVVDITLC
jgi:hypothetical protein